MNEWRKTSNRAGAQEYKAAHGVVFQVATGGWMAIAGGMVLRAPECDAFRHTARALRAGVTPGAFRTAALAMRAADGARDAAKAREYVAQREAGFPAMRAAAVRTAREDDSAMHAPGLSSATRLATFRRVASDEHQRLAFRAAGGIGFGEMWNAWRDAYRAERCALTQARVDVHAAKQAGREAAANRLASAQAAMAALPFHAKPEDVRAALAEIESAAKEST